MKLLASAGISHKKIYSDLINKLTSTDSKWRDEFWGSKIPRSVPSPNSITIVRMIGAILLLFIKVDMAYFVPIISFLFLTDYFDGIIARTQDKVTAFGDWADHTADKLLLFTVVYRIYFINPFFWNKYIWQALLLEIAPLFIGILFLFIKSSIRPEANFMGQLKFSFYAFAIIFFMMNQLFLAEFLMILGLIFAYLSTFSYLLRGLKEKGADI